MKRRATGLLAAVTAAFVGLVVVDSKSAWAAAALAAAEGSMVGGLADWFAVTALFRHPLGVPIPHTAIIRERKDQFGATLGDFVQENFLSADVVVERIRSSGVVARGAAWLADPHNGDTVAGALLEALSGAIAVIEDADVQRVVHDEVDRLAGELPLAPAAGRLIALATAEGRHKELFDVALKGVIGLLEEQREPLRERFGEESPWWLPDAVEDKLFDRIINGAQLLLASVVADPEHSMRAAVDDRLAALADRLQHDPELAERARTLARELLAHPELRTWTAGIWTDVKRSVRDQAPDPASALRGRTAGAVTALGRRLQSDTEMTETIERWVERGASHLLERYQDEIGDLITSTVALWDAEETSDKLELLLGRDLQFIRINGTIVGALAGLALHAVAQVAG